MDNTEIATIRKLQAVLQKIDRGIPVFFNVAEYERLGLVYSTENHGKDASVNDTVIDYTWHLTEKAKQYITVLV